MVKGFITVMGKPGKVVPEWYDITAVSYYIQGEDGSKVDGGFEYCKAYEADEVFDLLNALSSDKVEKRVTAVMREIALKFEEAGVTDLYVEDEAAIEAIKGSALMAEGNDYVDDKEYNVAEILDKYTVHKVADEYGSAEEYAAVTGVKLEYRLIKSGCPMLKGKDLWKMLDGRVMNENKSREIDKLVERIMSYTKVEVVKEDGETESDRVWKSEMFARKARFVSNVGKLGEKGKAAVNVMEIDTVAVALGLIE